MREFAILDIIGNQNIRENIISRLPEGSKITIFSLFKGGNADLSDSVDIRTVKIPEELENHESKIRNFAYRTMMGEKKTGFVHFIDENVQIVKEISPFLDAVEDMMDTFSLKSWFNTTCDPCNYVLTKYNPRLTVKVDLPGAERLVGKNIHWCSNANTAWICVNMDSLEEEDILFRETFDIPMFYIIEFLARRRNNKSPGELYYMNMYPGIDEELGTFHTIENRSETRNNQKEFAEEDLKFKEMGTDIHPDMDMDMILEDMAKKISVSS